VQPSDVVNSPVGFDGDQIEDDGCRVALIDEFDGCGGFAWARIVYCNVEVWNIPILSINERVAVEVGGFMAVGGVLLIFADQCRERRFEIAPQNGVAIKGNTLPILAPVSAVNSANEGERRYIGPRRRGEGSEGGAGGTKFDRASR
jgi:hypothetical protein